MKKKLLKTLGWILLVATIIVFYDNFSVMTALVVVLVIMNYGPGIFITVGKKIIQFAFGKIASEFKPNIKKDPSAHKATKGGEKK